MECSWCGKEVPKENEPNCKRCDLRVDCLSEPSRLTWCLVYCSEGCRVDHEDYIFYPVKKI